MLYRFAEARAICPWYRVLDVNDKNRSYSARSVQPFHFEQERIPLVVIAALKRSMVAQAKKSQGQDLAKLPNMIDKMHHNPARVGII